MDYCLFKTDRKISLAVALSGSFIIFLIAAMVTMGSAAYYNIREIVKQEVQSRIHMAAALAGLQIDSGVHAKILETEDGTGAEYRSLRSKLLQFKKADPNIRYIYTFRMKQDGKLVFILDAERNSKLVSRPGQEYLQVSKALRDSFLPPYKIHIENDLQKDDWGTWLSGYAPMLDSSGRLEGVIGIDVAASTLSILQKKYFRDLLLWILPLCIAAILCGFQLARFISRPIEQIAQQIMTISELNFTGDRKTESPVLELNQIGLAVLAMRRVLRSFARFVPRDLVYKVISSRTESSLEAERRVLTIFFSDVSSFTSISENLKPEELSRYLESYFAVMASVIQRNNGTIDKFIGDAVMAFWGAPAKLEDHAYFACKAALECQSALQSLFSDWQKLGIPKFSTRIGLNTGEALVGNFGYADRLSYTVIGDQVNLTNRVESLNKHYGTSILVSESTWSLVKERFEFRYLDQVTVKGRTGSTKVYELIGSRETT
jgi:class 3 adenylate cyclase